jgi:hypothetical protein
MAEEKAQCSGQMHLGCLGQLLTILLLVIIGVVAICTALVFVAELVSVAAKCCS